MQADEKNPKITPATRNFVPITLQGPFAFDHAPRESDMWATRLPVSTAAAPSASGNATTRQYFPVSQQSQAAVSNSASVTGRNGFTALDQYAGTSVGSTDSSRSAELTELSAPDVPGIFQPSYNGFYPTHLSELQPKLNNTTHLNRFLDKPALPSLNLQHSQFTPAPTPNPLAVNQGNFPDGQYQSTGIPALVQQSFDAMGRSRRSNKTVTDLQPRNTRNGQRSLTLADRAIYSDGIPEASSRAYDSSLSLEENPSLSMAQLSINNQYNNARNGIANAAMNPAFPNDEEFLDHYFSHGNAITSNTMSDIVDDRWSYVKASEARVPSRASMTAQWNDSVEPQTPIMNSRRGSQGYAFGGIDHYHGSPQPQPRGRNGQQAHMHSMQTGYSGSGGYPQSGAYSGSSQRCGPNCYSTRLELNHTRKQLDKCMRERDHLYRHLNDLEHKFKASENAYHKLVVKVRAERQQHHMARDFQATSTPMRLQVFYSEFVKETEDQLRRGIQIPGDMKNDEYFQSEFNMFFRGIKCWAERFLKFPNHEKFPRELVSSLKEVCGRDEYMDSLLTSDKTKSFVVQGLVTRLLTLAVLRSTGLQVKGKNSEDEAVSALFS